MSDELHVRVMKWVSLLTLNVSIAEVRAFCQPGRERKLVRCSCLRMQLTHVKGIGHGDECLAALATRRNEEEHPRWSTRHDE